MPRGTRRRFLKYTGLGAASIAAAKLDPNSLLAATGSKSVADRRSLALPGVHAYAGRDSVFAGETISFYVSSSVPYEMSVCRLGDDVENPAQDEILHRFGQASPRVQPILPGSFIEIHKSIGHLNALSLECWVRPWKLDASAGLITQFDRESKRGFALVISEKGSVSFMLGNGAEVQSVLSTQPLKGKQWNHVVATWDGREARVWANGSVAGRSPFTGSVDARNVPLRLAAFAKNKIVDRFLDGDLAMPAIYKSALSPGEVERRYKDRAVTMAMGANVLASWPLFEERGENIHDISGFKRNGRLINHATWMIGGPSFEANVPRFGNYAPKQDPRRGHALRFASDDLYDCGWQITHRYRIPPGARSGMYVGRIEYEWEKQKCLYHVTFIVRRAKRRPAPPILVLAATNTWRAYNAAAFPQPKPGVKHVCGTNGMANSPGDPPAFSFYRGHAAGQGTYQIGLRTPWPSAGPYLLYGGPTDYSHLMRADRFAHVWLERAGYKYDLISDLDLHRDPDQIRSYRTFIINGHSEYWSIPMYVGLKRYLASGGNVIVLSGNSLFWRVSFNDEESILECRKVDAPGEQVPASRRGEAWHSHDGLRGGLLRECGFPGWKLIGLETLGWNNQSDPEQFGAYLVDAADHFLFQKPQPCSLKSGQQFGHGSEGTLPRANGHEIDVRLSTLAKLQQQPAPQGTQVPADPDGIVRLANGVIPWKRGGAAFDYFFRGIKPATDQGGEMIYWERPEGGRVFNAGSIGAGWGLLADSKFQMLMRNVLSHFGVTA